LNEQTKEERKFKPCGLPIGLMPAAEYEVRETTFSNGERLAVFSDGVTDAVNTDEENFEENGLAESFKEITAKDVEGIGTEFFEILDRFRMGASPTDDTTFLVVGLD
jgi:sigma-B regulation protein RsbU (phosphoserine phosphatase)